jgi:hypothetical protein
VNVAGRLELLRIVAGVLREQTPVLLDVGLVVAPALTEVQRRASAGGHPAGPLREPVYESFAWEDMRCVELDRGAHREAHTT